MLSLRSLKEPGIVRGLQETPNISNSSRILPHWPLLSAKHRDKHSLASS